MSSSVRVVGLFLLVALFFSASLWLYRKGGEGVINSIERQNNEAARRADESALDYDACRDAGRVWDFRAGKCTRVAAGGRN